MKVETFVKSLIQSGFTEEQSQQVVRVMEDMADIKLSPVLAQVEGILHKEINSQTWKIVSFVVAIVGVGIAVLKYSH